MNSILLISCSSGKNWYGEEFSQGQVRSCRASFLLPSIPAYTGNATVRFKAVSRSFGGPSMFNLFDGSRIIGQINIPPVASGPYDQFARTDSTLVNTILPGSFSGFGIDFAPAGSNTQGWLDWLEFFPERSLDMLGLSSLSFRTFQEISPGAIAEYVLTNTPALIQTWDVTDTSGVIETQLINDRGMFPFVLIKTA